MTQEEKQLLLIDLCARLPYGVICHYNCVIPIEGRELHKANCKDILKGIIPTSDGHIGFMVGYDKVNALEGDIKPYLRPMSSMTEEEKEYIKNRWCYNDWDIDGPSSLWREKIDVEDAEGIIDYFNEHHFDYRGLIEKGLAFEAPEDVYKQ